MNKLLSTITFITVTSLVIFGADFTIKKGLDTEPNTKVIAQYLKLNQGRQLAYKVLSEEPAVLGTTTSDNPQVDSQMSNLTTECRIKIVDKMNNNRSVVNLLKEMGRDTTFDNRARLAAINGIDDYTGTITQNQQLIFFLAKESICPESKI